MNVPSRDQTKARGPAQQSNASPLVSILIVNYNGAAHLRGCLDSLTAFVKVPHEIVVVDNASTDESLEILRRYPLLNVVQSDQNRGFAGGNNLGLKYCSGEYVLLLNNDTVAVPGFLEPLLEYLAQNPKVGVVQGKMLLPRFGNTLDVCGSFLTAVGMPYHYGIYKQDQPKYQRCYPVFSAKGACLMFRCTLIQHTGGFLFDEEFFCYYEESDFCYRAWIAGHEVHFVAGPAILHLMGATAGGPQSAFVLRHYLRNMSFSLMSNLSLGWRLRILPVYFLLLFCSMLGAAVRFRWRQVGAHVGAFAVCATRYGKIRKRRKLVESFRRTSDPEIFKKVLRNPRPGYFIKTFTGRLGSYEDGTLP